MYADPFWSNPHSETCFFPCKYLMEGARVRHTNNETSALFVINVSIRFIVPFWIMPELIGS